MVESPQISRRGLFFSFFGTSAIANILAHQKLSSRPRQQRSNIS
ncbi:MAG: hypothetical protein AAFQ80_24850 [Cyanobacteria bacterium J06621_8]